MPNKTYRLRSLFVLYYLTQKSVHSSWTSLGPPERKSVQRPCILTRSRCLLASYRVLFRLMTLQSIFEWPPSSLRPSFFSLGSSPTSSSKIPSAEFRLASWSPSSPSPSPKPSPPCPLQPVVSHSLHTISTTFSSHSGGASGEVLRNHIFTHGIQNKSITLLCSSRPSPQCAKNSIHFLR